MHLLHLHRQIVACTLGTCALSPSTCRIFVQPALPSPPPHSPSSLLFPSLAATSQLVCERKKAETEELRSQVQQLVRCMEEERRAKAAALGALMADLEVQGASG